MALLPFIVNEILDPLNTPQRPAVRYCPYLLKRSNSNSVQNGLNSQNEVLSIHNTKDGFKANLDVQQFQPEELSVRMVDDYVVVEGKHEERKDAHGFVSRQFQRRYKLPKDVDPDTVTSALSTDGVLTIFGPKKQPVPLADVNERIVPVIQTREPAIKKH
ncbi:hypothetical protein R5R35_008951 [Gryllus longicercus]|uniref:SHSP domain-containing protein n=1 Tax=Gryllus longicercus TaxID=2509291 RepID=A0AAN9VYD5_9ORTH